jgi:hypothetical protein
MKKLLAGLLIFFCVGFTNSVFVTEHAEKGNETINEKWTRYRSVAIEASELRKIRDDGTGLAQPLFFAMDYHLRKTVHRNIVTLKAYHNKSNGGKMTELKVSALGEDFDKFFKVDMTLNSFRMSRQSVSDLLSQNPSIAVFYFVPELYDISNVRYNILKSPPSKKGYSAKTDETGFYLNPSPPAPPQFE